MDWKKDCFQYFIEGKVKDGKTVPKNKTTSNQMTIEEVNEKDIFGGILKDGLVDISFDDAEMGSVFMEICKENNWKCFVFENPLNQHIHTVWNNRSGKIKKKSGADLKTACGLIVDVHGGHTYFRLRELDHERFPPRFDIDSLDDVPDELMIVNTKKELWNMKAGEARNSVLYGYIQVLQRQLHFSNDRCRHVINTINDHIFKDSLSEDELNVILREDAFREYEVKPLNSISASELITMDLPPVYFAVDNLLPMGLSIIASPPKFGKSFLCTQLSIAVASGSEFLGFKTHQSGVLYMALEDSFNRCKERLIQELQGKKPPRNLDIMIDCPTLGNGLIDQLKEYLKSKPETKLIIIDTFAKVRDGSKSNEGAYSSDYREAGLIKKFADENQIAVLLVHHTRKMKDDTDPFANISGTQGLTGACDTMMVLTKEKRVDDLTQLSITGRDVYQNEYGISRDKETGLWLRHEESMEQLTARINLQVSKMEYTNGNFRKTLFGLLEDEEQWSGRCSEIIKASKEYGYPIAETPQKLSRKIAEFNPFLLEDKIIHSEIDKGNASKIHKFEKSS